MTDATAPLKPDYPRKTDVGRVIRNRSRHRHKPAGGNRLTYAALDLGTNNCRLLVAEPAREGLHVVDAFSRIVRLGEGLGKGNCLSSDAINRTMQALDVCKAKLKTNEVSRMRLVATEACRTAENGGEFIARVKNELGLELEIVDRETEAFLAVAGCASLVDPRAKSSIIFDIGGGSTELAWLDGQLTGSLSDPGANIRCWDSLGVGVVTLAERYGGEEVSWETFEAMVAEVEDMLQSFAMRAAGADSAPYFHLLGTSGTVTTLGGIYLGLTRYDRRRVDGLWMSDDDISEVIETLMNMNFSSRASSPCIGKERADLVLAGCAILDAIRRTFPARFLRIADRGLREGILMKMMREDGAWRNGAQR